VEYCSIQNNIGIESIGRSILTVMHLNSQGFLSKSDELQIFLNDEGRNIDVISLNEHKIDEENINFLNKLRGYHLGAYYARKNSRYGGSCLLVKSNTNFKVATHLDFLNEDFIFEGCTIELPDHNKIITSIYTSSAVRDRKPFLDKLRRFVSLVWSNKKKEVLICSDCNVDLLKTSSDAVDLLSILEINGFRTNFKSPTRVAASSSTCIDNIFTSLNVQVLGTSNFDLGISDHRCLQIKVSTSLASTATNPLIIKRRYDENSIREFKRDLIENKWQLSLEKSVDFNFEVYMGKFLCSFNKCFPLKVLAKQPIYKKKSWCTLGIKTSSRRKRELHIQMKNSSDIVFIEYVKNYKRIFKKVLTAAKRMFNDQLINGSENKVSTVWSIVNSELGGKNMNNNSPIALDVEGTTIDDPEIVVNLLNDHFISVGDGPDTKVSPFSALLRTMEFTKNRDSNLRFSFRRVTTEEVQNCIMSLNNKKSSGWDNVPTTLIKKLHQTISRDICSLVNFSLSKGEFPSALKMALVTPIFKKGIRGSLDNYRPISVLTVFSKIFEKIVNNQLVRYLEGGNLFCENQFGFRRGRNTSEAVAKFVNEVVEALDGRKSVAGVFCDLTKAFDCVNHKIMLGKLELYGVENRELGWFKSYLENRKQKTILSVNGIKSESSWKIIKSGIPQGSILGPTLFLMYINDLQKNLTDRLTLFADDTTALVITKNTEQLLNNIPTVIVNLNQWFNINGLHLNYKKTNIVHFSTQTRTQFPPEIDTVDNTVQVIDDVKFLGVRVDRNLKWSSHILQLSKKLNSVCFCLSVLKNKVNKQTLITVYYAYFFPLLKYGIIMWGSCSGSLNILKTQKRAVRIILHLNSRESCRSAFKTLKILTLPSLFLLEILSYVHKNKDEFMLRNHSHAYSTRQRHDFQYPIHRLTLFERAPYYNGVKLYNRLPSHLRTLTSNVFRKSLKEILLEKAYYSVREFEEDHI
jgi:hypothetical protein